MFLKDGNLVIRRAKPEDAIILCNWWNDGKVMAHAGFPNGTNTSEQAIIDKLLGDDEEIHCRLILEIDGIPVGEMNYRNKGENVAELGIKICDFEKQEKGYGTRYLKMLIRYLFDDKGYKKIILDTNINNKRAQHVYEKIGFRQVEIRRDSWKNQLGELQTSIHYELSQEDFV